MNDKTPTDSKNKNLTERIVAFVDILGFKNMVHDSLNSQESANNLHEALKRIYDLKNHNESPTEVTSLREFGVEISTFSDSIVISYPIDYEGGLFFILMELIHLQLDLACYGILIRGGLSIGLLYHDGNIVYGPAMNEAYYLESKCAIYPRIIINKEDIIEGICKTRAEQNTMEQDIKYVMSCLKVDDDERFYLDILRQHQELGDWGDEYYNWLVNIRKTIVSGLNQYSNSPRIYKKYNWLKKYYNDVVTDRNALYPVPDESYCDQIGFRRSYLNLKIKKRISKGSDFW